MKIGDLVRARYNTGMLGIITKIERNCWGTQVLRIYSFVE